MDISELREVASQARWMRESGIAIVIASLVLAIFLFFPFAHEESVTASVAVATTTAPATFENLPSIEARATLVFDLATGEVLYGKNEGAQLPLASLTKLLTVYAAITQLSSEAPVTISTDAVRLGAPGVLSAGQIFSLSDLARLTLTASLNDGAAAIIEAVADRQQHSQYDALAIAALDLNLTQTYAVNGSGLDVSSAVSGGYGSALDIARLAGALVAQAPAVAAATTNSTTEAVSAGGTKFVVKNTDPLVGNIPNLLLSKTGYTDLAGGNLVLVFDIGMNHPIAVVVLGSSKKARFTDATTLVAAVQAYFAGFDSL